MVNVKNLFGMAVMATALVGCSSNDNLAPDGKDNVGKAGTAYAKFTIQLPTTSGTRVVDPNTGADFNGGTADLRLLCIPHLRRPEDQRTG